MTSTPATSMPVGRLGQVGDAHAGGGHVDELTLVLEEEMVMLGRVGVEIGLGPVHRELAQEARFGELVQGVVDRRQRDRHAGPGRLVEQHLGRDVPVALAEQEPAQGHPLPGRAQAHAAQLVPQLGQRAAPPVQPGRWWTRYRRIKDRSSSAELNWCE